MDGTSLQWVCPLCDEPIEMTRTARGYIDESKVDAHKKEHAQFGLGLPGRP